MDTNEVSILLVEDDSLTLQTNKRLLASYGQIITAKDKLDAENLILNHRIDIAFFDLNIEGELAGLELIKLAQTKDIYSIVVSGESSQTILEAAFVNGAKDYLAKPFGQEKLSQVINRFFNNRKHLPFENIINQAYLTKSAKQLEEIYKLKNLSISDKPLFISGETGTGKRIISHLLKEISNTNNFIEINCSQFSDELIASELFGHKKGAFTGATENKIGLLEKANNGIIFLDEIHALSLKAQKTLLKAIEEKEFLPVGSNQSLKSNFRLLSATCENIQELIDAGKFRNDLYARISTFKIHLMPLRERPEDIEPLFEHFISKHLVRLFITGEAKALLNNYSWPRNTREIQDLVENWIVNGQRLITPDILPPHIRHNINPNQGFIPDTYLDLVEEHGLNEFMTYLKKEIALSMIKRHGGSMRKAATIMGSSHSNLSGFLKTHQLKKLNEGRV